jgi:fatty-acyl-CoA synthase
MWGIWHWLERQGELRPHKAALVEGASEVHYGALAHRVACLSGGLAELGVGRGDRVAILAPNRMEYVEVLFACARLGALAVPLNWRLAAAELAYQVGDSEPAVLFADPELAALAESLRGHREAGGVRAWVLFGGGPGPSEGLPYDELLAANPAGPVGAPEDPFLVLYTSGTTGRPKGAVLTQASQFWNSVNIGTAVGLTFRDVTLNPLPLFHAGGIGLYTLPTLHVGGTAVLARKFEPEEITRLLLAHRVTAMFGVPSMYLMLLECQAFRQADLRGVRFACGGAPCPLRVIEAFRDLGRLFQQGYGLTETAPTCLIVPAEDAFRKAGSAGKPALHVEAKVVDEDGRDLPPGAVGEVWVRGPNLFSGYWRRPEATEEVFSGEWFKTGDLARRDEEGFFYIVDRKKDLIISGGENVYPAEVEEVLYRHPAVAEAAVVGVPHPTWGEVPHAVVVLKPGAELTADDLFRFCEPYLARYKIPRSLTVVDALPRNASGKVLKRALRERISLGA